MAQALLAANSDCIVWGSDWPHVRHMGVMPDDGALLEQLDDWGADAQLRHKILVTNPENFYDFKKTG